MGKVRTTGLPTQNGDTIDPPEVVRELAGVDRVLKLLVLYRKKLLRAVAEYRELPTVPNTGGLGNPPRPSTQGDPHRKQFRPLRPAVTKLAQHAAVIIFLAHHVGIHAFDACAWK